MLSCLKKKQQKSWQSHSFVLDTRWVKFFWSETLFLLGINGCLSPDKIKGIRD